MHPHEEHGNVTGHFNTLSVVSESEAGIRLLPMHRFKVRARVFDVESDANDSLKRELGLCELWFCYE